MQILITPPPPPPPSPSRKSLSHTTLIHNCIITWFGNYTETFWSEYLYCKLYCEIFTLQLIINTNSSVAPVLRVLYWYSSRYDPFPPFRHRPPSISIQPHLETKSLVEMKYACICGQSLCLFVKPSHVTDWFMVIFGSKEGGGGVIHWSNFICIFIFKKVCNTWPGSQNPFVHRGLPLFALKLDHKSVTCAVTQFRLWLTLVHIAKYIIDLLSSEK